MRRAPAFRALALILAAAPAAAGEPVRFDGWEEQKFSLFSSNDFAPAGEALDVASDGTVSLLWTALPAKDEAASAASWRWEVARSVPATDLTLKGGDDRNLALYFLWLPQSQAEEARKASILSLLDAEDARVLMYVWGGEGEKGEILPTPYLGARGRTVILRGAGTGAAEEEVDLAADHARAFGEAPGALVGLAVSADSDDTDTVIAAQVSGLVLE